MAMETVLDLQKLEVPKDEDLFATSTTSSWTMCCHGD